jgi:hypothetical protein
LSRCDFNGPVTRLDGDGSGKAIRHLQIELLLTGFERYRKQAQEG